MNTKWYKSIIASLIILSLASCGQASTAPTTDPVILGTMIAQGIQLTLMAGTLTSISETQSATAIDTATPFISQTQTATAISTIAPIMPESTRQLVDYNSSYLFKIAPITGANGYLWGFFQNGVLVWENNRDEGKFSENEYSIMEGSVAHSKFKPGNVEVWVRANVAGQWTEPIIITIDLEP
jgi:hypothetical protein